MKNETDKKGIAGFVYPDFSNEELKQLEHELETNYKISKTIDGKPCNFYNEVKWYQDNGAMGYFGGIIIDGTPPYKYELLRDKLQQLYKFQGRREYAQKMNREETKQDLEEFVEVLQQKLPNDSDINPFSVKY